MGVVVEARRDDLDRVVALKLLAPTLDPEARLRFRREGELLARVRHPNVLAVHEVGEEDGVAWLACERVEGESLEEVVGRGGLPPRTAVALVRAVAEGVGALHALGIVHRDVKPANILIRPDGSPVLIDLGVARDLAAPGLTATHELIGTPSYMPPEQLTGGARAGPLADVWALGGVLYALLTGQPPFKGGSLVELAEAVRSQPVEWPEADAPVPAALREIVERALARDPSARTPSALALARALGAWLGEPPRAVPGTTWRRVGSAVAAAAGLLALAVVGLELRARRPEAGDPVAALGVWEAAVVEPWDLGLGAGRPPTPAEVEGWLARLRAAGRDADDAVARLQAYRRLLGLSSAGGPTVADRGLAARLEALAAARSGQHAAAVRLLEARLRAAPDDRAAARHLARAWEGRLAEAGAGELGDAVELLVAWLARASGPGAPGEGGLLDVRRRAVVGLARAHAARVARRTFGAPTLDRLRIELAEPARAALRLGVDAEGWSAATAEPAAASLAGAGGAWVGAAAAAAGDERRALDALARARASLAAEPAALPLAGAVLDALLAPVLAAFLSEPSVDGRRALALRAAQLDLASFSSGPEAAPGALCRRAPTPRLGEVMDRALRDELQVPPEVALVAMRSCGHELGIDRILACFGGVDEAQLLLRTRWPWSRALRLLVAEKLIGDASRPQVLHELMSDDDVRDLSPPFEARGWSCWVRDEGLQLHGVDVPTDPAGLATFDGRVARLVERAAFIRRLAPTEPTTLRQVHQGEVYGLRRRAPDRAFASLEEGLASLRALQGAAIAREDAPAAQRARRELVKMIATGLALFGEQAQGPWGLGLAREAVAAITAGTGEDMGYEVALPWMRIAREARTSGDPTALAKADEELTRLAKSLDHEGFLREWVEVALARGDRALARARVDAALVRIPASQHLRALKARLDE